MSTAVLKKVFEHNKVNNKSRKTKVNNKSLKIEYKKTSLTQSPNSEHLNLKISNKKKQQILSVRWNSTSYLN